MECDGRRVLPVILYSSHQKGDLSLHLIVSSVTIKGDLVR
jgi:hypothetical protein